MPQNNFDSNITRQLARIFLEKFESARMLSKNVNTQLLAGRFNPSSGDTVDFKRPTDYTTSRNPTGDATGTADPIITGKASGIVQDYFTVLVDFDEADEAIRMDQIDQLLAPMATRIVTDLELDFAAFMVKNSGLLAGLPGAPVKKWEDVAEASSVMQSAGIPMDEMWKYAMNPFTTTALASDQRSLGAGGTAGELIKSANAKAVIVENFANFRVMTATTLASLTTDGQGDRAGVLSATPDGTYLTAKDTMTQALAVSGFTSGLVVKAGETVTVTGHNRLNLSTRKVVLDEEAKTVTWTATVTQDVTLTGGAGTLIVTGPAIFESEGAFNTVDSALVQNDVVTLGNVVASDTVIQPNLFWHPQAFSIGSVPIKKLFSTDTLATTEDGLRLRVSKFSDGVTNRQSIRFDLRPAYAALNPFFAGQGFGPTLP